MCFSSPKIPETDTAPYIPSVEETDSGVTASRDNERRRKAAANGRKSTMLTGGAGASGKASTAGKTLLGQ